MMARRPRGPSALCLACGLPQEPAGELGAARCRACGGELVRALEPSLPSSAALPPLPDGALGEEVALARSDQRRRFGRFVLFAELGPGGMGVVWRAWDQAHRREGALETLHAEGSDAEGQVRRFAREAEAISRLRHPGIAPVHDAGEEDGRAYIAMALVRGTPLSKAPRRRWGKARGVSPAGARSMVGGRDARPTVLLAPPVALPHRPRVGRASRPPVTSRAPSP